MKCRWWGGSDRQPGVGGLVVAFWSFMALAPAVLPVGAQSEDPGVFAEMIDVRVVNLEVVVTDKKGVRVNGLLPEDFVLTVDGREVGVDYFTEVLGGQSVAPGAAAGTVPALAPGEPVGTSYLVFIDEYFSVSRDRNRVLDRLVDELALLGPEDRMAVVAYDGKTIDMLSSWSQSQSRLDEILRDARNRRPGGLQRIAERRTFQSSAGLRAQRAREPTGFGASVPGLDQGLSIEEEAEAERIADQVGRVVLAASAALRGFANPPGRKVMILLSGGWPYNPAQWVVDSPQRAIYATSVSNGDDLFQPLIETANRLSYTLYTVDVPGIDTVVSGVGGLSADPLVDTSGFAVNGSTTYDREWDQETSLRRLAEQTGGKALINSASGDPLQRVVEDTRSYYWLGFAPQWEGNDDDHKVRVRTRRKGLKVRSRQSFADLSPQTEVSMMVESSLLFGNAPSAESFPVQLGPPEKAGFGKVEVPFKVAIPLHALTFLPGAEGHQAVAELRIAVLDENGSTAEIPIIPLTIRTTILPVGERFQIYESRMRLRRKRHDLVFSLFEPATGKILSSRQAIDPGPKKKSKKRAGGR